MKAPSPLPETFAKPAGEAAAFPRRLFLVGSPNVGKSVLFNALTGSYATVSNYPGTTVEVSRGTWRGDTGLPWEVVDTPGMYSLRPITEEERVARDLLLREPGLILHVVDAKNLPRMLPLTLELALLGRPMAVVCNLMDEALDAGVSLDCSALSRALGLPVIPAVAIKRSGLSEIEGLLLSPPPPPPAPEPRFPAALEAALKETESRLPGPAARFWALRHLEGDPIAAELAPLPASAGIPGGAPFSPRAVPSALKAEAGRILEGLFEEGGGSRRRVSSRLDALLMNPWSGFPILAAVLYLGLYEFVGVFGGGTLVEFLEGTVFEGHVNPFLEALFRTKIPWPWIHGLFVGEFGILTLGMRYAVAIIMPIVGTFFLAFSVLEDSGYLPRLAMLLDGLFKRIGLNGRAVIPLVLGFGCDTMATIVTRILETKRERIIATFLLALAVPCSAQLGVILGLLGGHPGAFALWVGIVGGVFLAAGTALGRLLPGEKPSFFMELPPLRFPSIRNVWAKTVSRMGWYFLEVLPLFVVASALIWMGQITGLFELAVSWMKPLVAFLGLPPEASTAFLFGFFRRDYGAAGLYDLNKAGALNGAQILVATVTLTLFLPCVAQFLMMKKERGWAVTLLMSGAILLLAFGVGGLLNAALLFLGARL